MGIISFILFKLSLYAAKSQLIMIQNMVAWYVIKNYVTSLIFKRNTNKNK